MRRSLISTVILAAVLALVACGPKGETPGEKRKAVRNMRTEALNDLFEMEPGVRAKLKRAAGYGVFTNIESKIMFIASGSGYGVVTDNKTGKETFMKMAKFGGGVGMGIQSFRGVFVFNNREVMNRFVEEGWEFGGGADVSAKSGEKGAAATGDMNVDTGGEAIEVYQFTDSGVSLSAVVMGTKYWKDDDLN